MTIKEILGFAVGALVLCGCSDGAREQGSPIGEAAAALTLPKHQPTPLPFDPARGLLLEGTVVTMDAAHRVLEHAKLLVRGDRIVNIWQGEHPPPGTQLGDAIHVDLGPSALIFPGMINLHDHPSYDALPLWPAPSSHAQPELGRPLGSEPYANRYQWNAMHGHASPEQARLIVTPHFALTSPEGLNLETEVIKYAKIKGLLGGQTTSQGATSTPASDGVLSRNVDSPNFGRQAIGSTVGALGDASPSDVGQLVAGMRFGLVDAWLFHLGEGVRDGDRRPGDPDSSRAEFETLKSDGLLTDMTVVVHGVALEASDFEAMRAARSTRLDGSGDGLGAKLVWSPLSNLLLYGRTANVYEALAAGVTVSLGTDWSPSGSRNLLGELKIADIALRDPAVLGASRHLLPELAVEGKNGEAAERAERALDQLIVDMATRNPAATVRWQNQVGSLEAGKAADLFVISADPDRPRHRPAPRSPYRSLIDATERDVRLVVVGGEPLVGDVDVLEQLKPDDAEVIASGCGCYQKAIDVTRPGVEKGGETVAEIQRMLSDGLAALGGDAPPANGGPAELSNTYSYLKQHVVLPFPMTDAQFRQFVLIPIAGTIDGKLNLERVQLTPILTDEDDFLFDVLGARTDPATGLISDVTPPFGLYSANFNQQSNGDNPFAAASFEDRWYPLQSERGAGRGHACNCGGGTSCDR